MMECWNMVMDSWQLYGDHKVSFSLFGPLLKV
uniref:Uncharacterized protein n=1 Tax=Rhizophora mucronata TaxID=61149 RepID=A0A2P2NHD0_RHIMU